MNPLNIHPLLVHFPIALLTIYSLLEIIPIKKIQQLPYLFYTKAIILIFGFTAILPTILTGLIIQQEFSNQQALVSLHSQFGELSAAIYGILTIIYTFSWIKKTQIKRLWTNILAFFGLISLVITGALGATIVYGPNLDPFTSIIYKIFSRGVF